MASNLPDIDAFRPVLASELAAIESPRHRAFADSILVEPYQKTLRWEYGDGEAFPAWVFADFKERDVGAAYCAGGFGALGSPWGLIFFSNDSFGIDSGWYPTLGALIEDWSIEA